jgi:quinoprotein glucose dehydrogenase
MIRPIRLLSMCGLLASLACTAQPQEWRHYGQDPGGARYSGLREMTRDNVANLERAWTFRTGDIAAGSAHYAECTPLVVDGVLYVITPFSRLIALDATTGTELWRFTPDPPLDISETAGGGLASRGVAYSDHDGKSRIFLPVRDGRIYAIDTVTHKPDQTFGAGGYIDLRAGLPDDGDYLFLSSPPTLYKHVLIQPYGINDTSNHRNPYVPVRAFDARTGALLWTFDTIPRPGQAGHDSWGGDSWKGRGGCNPWAPISVDTARGIFYLPVGAPNNDKFGGDRPGDNLFANSIVALDALTGKRLWHFQTVHHDLWDYDLAAMPTLFDMECDGETLPAVAVVGKTGFAYVFNRVTGAPLFSIEERAVPESTVPGEAASPTQPFPTKPPAFARQRLTRSDLHATKPGALGKLQSRFDDLRSEGLFTPPSPEGTIVFPGQLGGGNWSGAAVSPEGMMYITSNELPYVTQVKPGGTGPFGVSVRAGHFLDSEGYPAVKPPWGTVTKLDLVQGTIVWQKPLGNYSGLNLDSVGATGQMNFGGGTVTAGGLFFVAAALDSRLRVFDTDTGRVLARYDLEVPGQGAPVTYRGRDGKQYVALYAGGGGKGHGARGDYVIAFRLR